MTTEAPGVTIDSQGAVLVNGTKHNHVALCLLPAPPSSCKTVIRAGILQGRHLGSQPAG